MAIWIDAGDKSCFINTKEDDYDEIVIALRRSYMEARRMYCYKVLCSIT